MDNVHWKSKNDWTLYTRDSFDGRLFYITLVRVNSVKMSETDNLCFTSNYINLSLFSVDSSLWDRKNE